MTAQVCAGGDAWVCVAVGGTVRAHARSWLPSASQSLRRVYPVGVTDGGLLSRVMSELATISLGRDEVMNGFLDTMLAVHMLLFF